jgi:hypothetical protein
MICNHEEWSKLQNFHSYFLFVFYLVYYLQIMDSGLPSSQFEQHLTLINWFLTYAASWMCSLEGKFGEKYKEGAPSDDEVQSRN